MASSYNLKGLIPNTHLRSSIVVVLRVIIFNTFIKRGMMELQKSPKKIVCVNMRNM